MAFIASGLIAYVFKAFSPLGLTRRLLQRDKMPLYPEQASFRAAVSDEEYTQWLTAVDRTFRDGAGPELRSVIPIAREAERRTAATGRARFEIPVGVLNSPSYGAKWLQWQEDTASRAASGFHRVTETPRHNIHMQHPDLVVEAIRELLVLVG